MSIFRRCTFLIVGMSTAAAAQTATAFHDLDALDAEIATALGAPIGAPGGAAQPLDRRLRLAACREPMAVSPARQGASTVSCGTNNWRIRIAVVPTTAPSGTPTAPTIVDQPSAPVVARGDQVRAFVVGTGFSVSTVAVAEESGTVGQRIRIRIDGRPRSTYAVVTSPGHVQL
jgi:flagellar basal body P-ring formation protein FlgA